ncbi:hypothetical protein [Roseinatronobacter alkalisoli]|uniref:EF-hand domain-containing protein n=1 Tax=Roseinatronobacter alkalisoli TaxID=3028235 RepID=A0ABT5TCM1_9RHOB|nr:hypothetical protein [Roseinatronobacter sp. HJB301]MDD7972870.1 hypothetical protein [Roseinatronobacter sp. HJB301]
MADTISWHVVTGRTARGTEPIGAVGFIGNNAVIVISFFDDYDGNKDGRVSWGEWAAAKLSPLSLKNKSVVEVAMAGRYDVGILSRDPSFNQMAMQMFQNFASGLIADGIYAAYFARGVRMGAGAAAVMITNSKVKQFVIRKGFEKAVKEAFDASVT